MVVDNISNLIISLKNASIAGKDYLEVPATKMSSSILNVLKDNKFISNFEVKGSKIKVDLKYENGSCAITDVKRISKGSKRVYQGSKDIKSIKRGYGMSVISTPEGVMSSDMAKEKKIGGEVLFEIW